MDAKGRQTLFMILTVLLCLAVLAAGVLVVSVLPQAHRAKSIETHSSMHKIFEIFFIFFTLTFVRCHKNCS